MALLETDRSVMAEHKCLLSLCFEIKDLGPVKQILGHEIDYDHEHQVIWLFQTRYIQESLERYNITDGRSHPTPLSSAIKLSKDDCPQTEAEKEMMCFYPYQSLIGTLMYAMLGTRPDIAFAVGALSKFSSNPGLVHWQQAVHVLRYLGGTKDLGLVFRDDDKEDLSTLVLESPVQSSYLAPSGSN